MNEFSLKIAEFIFKYYNINRLEISMMIEDEIEFIEEAFYENERDVKSVAKELISIYMVA